MRKKSKRSKNLTVGILREAKYKETRAPLTPNDVSRLRKRGISVEVESNPERIFSDKEYRKAGAAIVKRFRKASLLVGIKEPQIEELYANKIYMLFSHTHKGQKQNRDLLKAFVRKNITLIDYELITDSFDKRLVYFGRFAGICGAIDALCYMGRRLESRNIHTPFAALEPAHHYGTLTKATKALEQLRADIHTEGLDKRVCPFVVGITGHGHVSSGIQEILDILDSEEIHPKDMKKFIRHERGINDRIFRIVFLREERYRSKHGNGFYFDEYLEHPRRYESNMDKYLKYLNMLLHASYWDHHFPRLVTKEMMQKFYNRNFRLQLIGDISCDVKGGIELTEHVTTPDDPTYTYNPREGGYIEGFGTEGVTIMARDNLPTEMPKDASKEFSSLIRDYVCQIAQVGRNHLTQKPDIPEEIKKAIITQSRRLTKRFSYLKKYTKGK